MGDLLDRLTAALAGSYAVERELGSGGMATVYRAEDLKHHRQVAVKVLRPELAAALGPERFLREIEIAAQLHHPHILPLYDSGEADGFLYYVMPLAEGESLRDRLIREKQLPLDDACQIAREVADALSYAHSRNVVHRDIKPENILLESGHAIVTDFGIARAISAAGGERLTQTGVAVGTPAYMSPEQAGAGGTLDGRSDLYSLACVLYEMLAGQPPFTGPTAESIVHQHLAVDPPTVTAIRPAVPAALGDVLARALAKNPADRFPTAAQLTEGLKQAGTAVAPRTWRLPLRRRWTAAVGTLALAALVGVWLVVRGPARETAGSAARQLRIVVLPFENLGAADDEFFADGLTEEITARLATIPDLGIIARTSANQYKNVAKTIREIGRELRVQYVLEGSVRWQRTGAGTGRLRVTPQLIRVSDETHLWAEVYDGDAADVFQVQADIAQQVRAALRLTLGVAGRPASTAPPTTNLEAYEVFLRANAETERAGAGDRDFARALSLYEGAVSMDPDFAEAWARLGRVAAQVYWFEGRPEHLERAREAVQRALALNPDLPDAHLAQGYVHYYGERAYDQALREFLLAQQGQPGNADIVMAIGLIQRRQGNLEAAAQTLVEAAELDPRSSLKAQTTGETLSWMRRFEAALPYYDRAMELEPSSIRPYSRKAGTYFAMGQQDRTRETLRDGFRKAGVSPVQFLSQAATDEDAWLGFVDQWHGMEEIDRALERLSIDPRTRPTTYYLVKAQWRRYQANLAAARVYFDSARVATEQVLARDPGDAKAHSRLAFALAGLERKEEALREANHAVELLPVSKDLFDGSRLVRIRAEVSIMLGDYEVALDDLEYLLSIPSETTVGSLGIEESMRPLRDHPRMRRLLAAR